MEKLQQKTLTKDRFFPQATGSCWAHGSCKYGDARPSFWFCQACAVTKVAGSQPSWLVIAAPGTGVSADRRHAELVERGGHGRSSSAAPHPGLSASNRLCQNQPLAPLGKQPGQSVSQSQIYRCQALVISSLSSAQDSHTVTAQMPAQMFREISLNPWKTSACMKLQLTPVDRARPTAARSPLGRCGG